MHSNLLFEPFTKFSAEAFGVAADLLAARR